MIIIIINNDLETHKHVETNDMELKDIFYSLIMAS